MTDPILGIAPGDCAYLRGHLTRDECAEALAEEATVCGDPHHTWGRRGFWADENGVLRCGGLHLGARYAGVKGAFRVTVIGVVEGS